MTLLLIYIIMNGSEHYVGQLGGFNSFSSCTHFVRSMERHIHHGESDLQGKKFKMVCSSK